MGNYLFGNYGKMFQNLFKGRKKQKFVVVGLDAAGKTTILYKLKLGETFTTIPTIGFNIEILECKKMSFMTWDVGGEDKIRPLWRHYMVGMDSLIFVVDSNDRERLPEARDEFSKIMTMNPPYNHQPVLIFLNKQDLPNALNVNEFCKKFRMNEFFQKFKTTRFFIQPCCAVTGEGLFEGFDWIAHASEFDENYEKLRVIWKKGWKVEYHMIFPQKYRKLVWSFLLVSIRKLEIPIEIFQSIICYLNPMENEDFSEIKRLVERANKNKILK